MTMHITDNRNLYFPWIIFIIIDPIIRLAIFVDALVFGERKRKN